MNHQGTVVLKTDRLILRPFVIEDAQPMFDNWASDPEVTRFLTWPTHPSVDVTKQVVSSWIDSYNENTTYQWAIVPVSGEFGDVCGQPIGSISAVKIREDIGEAEFGYCIGRRWWHMGVTSEALAAVIAFFFEQVGANRIEAHHAVDNPRSGAVMTKCGMIHEGTCRKSDRCNSGIVDMCIYGILAEDHFASKASDAD